MDASRITQLILGCIALKIAFLFVLAWNSRFVMDEFVQFGLAKYLGNELFDTIWPGKSVGYAVFFKLAHLLGWDSNSILLIGRIQTALLACATMAIIYLTARALKASQTAGLLIVLMVLSFSNILERIFRTIAEPPALFFAAAALLVVVRKGPHRWPLIAAGALSGLAFLTTQKSVYFNVALGLGLVGDAMLHRSYREGFARGALLVLGWTLPVICYCLIFGGGQPLAIAQHLFLGPAAVLSPQVPAEYGGLRRFVLQTLVRNFLLYLFCFGGMLTALLRIKRMEQRRRIALIFTVVLTALVFTHDQPWPYVFIMALPFMALWAVEPLELLGTRRLHLVMASAVLALAIGASFSRNIFYLRFGNQEQLALVARAEKLVRPDQVYFDGVGMLPNRKEPSLLWLDRITIRRTLHEGTASEAYRLFANSPPKVILWSYRLDAIHPLIAPVIDNSYVSVAPNIRSVGRRLTKGEATLFQAPLPGTYALYSESGQRLSVPLEVDGKLLESPLRLVRGTSTIALPDGPPTALLLPEGSYAGLLAPGPDNDQLFAHVYD